MDATLLLAVALAATCGLRTFVPLLAISVLAGTGVLPLQPVLEPLATLPAALVLAALSIAEVLLDKIPRIREVMAVVGFALRPIAGMLVALALLPVDPLSAMGIGAVGAMTLGVVQARLRAAATEAAGGHVPGIALSSFEDAVVLAAVVVALVAPALTLVGLATLAGAAALASGLWQRHRWARMAVTTA